MEALNTWWSSLTLLLKIYWIIAIPFSIFFLLQLVASFIGGGDTPDSDVDGHVEADHGIAFQFLTLKNMIGFFTIFAWAGIAAIDSGFSESTSLIVSFVSGLLMMTLMAGAYFLMSKMNVDGNLKIERAVGQVGEVYLTIQSRRGSIGKIQINVMGSLRTMEAMTDDAHDLSTGKVVMVSKVLNDNILLVTANKHK